MISRVVQTSLRPVRCMLYMPRLIYTDPPQTAPSKFSACWSICLFISLCVFSATASLELTSRKQFILSFWPWGLFCQLRYIVNKGKWLHAVEWWISCSGSCSLYPAQARDGMPYLFFLPSHLILCVHASFMLKRYNVTVATSGGLSVH